MIGQAGDLVRVRLPADRESLRAIATAGAVVGRFDPAVCAYAAIVPLAAGVDLPRRLRAGGGVHRPGGAVATSVVGTDSVRSHDANAGLFGGGVGHQMVVFERRIGD